MFLPWELLVCVLEFEPSNALVLEKLELIPNTKKAEVMYRCIIQDDKGRSLFQDPVKQILWFKKTIKEYFLNTETSTHARWRLFTSMVKHVQERSIESEDAKMLFENIVSISEEVLFVYACVHGFDRHRIIAMEKCILFDVPSMYRLMHLLYEPPHLEMFMESTIMMLNRHRYALWESSLLWNERLLKQQKEYVGNVWLKRCAIVPVALCIVNKIIHITDVRDVSKVGPALAASSRALDISETVEDVLKAWHSCTNLPLQDFGKHICSHGTRSLASIWLTSPGIILTLEHLMQSVREKNYEVALFLSYNGCPANVESVKMLVSHYWTQPQTAEVQWKLGVTLHMQLSKDNFCFESASLMLEFSLLRSNTEWMNVFAECQGTWENIQEHRWCVIFQEWNVYHNDRMLNAIEPYIKRVSLPILQRAAKHSVCLYKKNMRFQQKCIELELLVNL